MDGEADSSPIKSQVNVVHCHEAAFQQRLERIRQQRSQSKALQMTLEDTLAGWTASLYKGSWTPQKLRSELGAALSAKFPGQVDASGTTALEIKSSTARVDADVVPCFSYRYYVSSGSRPGTKIFTTTGRSIVNYPSQQLDNGRAKNVRTGTSFKKAVRVLKRVENAMLDAGAHGEVPSYFIECLAYNCPDSTFAGATWTAITRGMLVHIWNALQGEEPTDAGRRWLEVNECFYLFHGGQKWSRANGRDFAQAAWTFLGYTS